ncbi:kinase-like domain-containing protein [Cristinia sonorae]|uniref:Kinase-like domain-containing protein n=1 Tax=Cristinia sonorae TaxID=1940300 RepID=A0A8K0UGV0_9AGAR|nr:kinase-like domain-containing protein [Cristinia sonorae]
MIGMAKLLVGGDGTRVPFQSPMMRPQISYSVRDDLDDMYARLQMPWDDADAVDRGERIGVLRGCLQLAVRHSSLPKRIFLRGVTCSDTIACNSGSFADVFSGTYHGSRVALRTLRVNDGRSAEEREGLLKAFCRETLLWSALSHDHIVPFLGVCDNIFTSSMCMVLPWMETDMTNLLRIIRAGGELSSEQSLLNIQTWLFHIGSGLNYLHDMGIVHGDLHGSNVLVDASGHARLTDFGMSTLAEAMGNAYGSLHGGGAAHFRAPELIDPEELLANGDLLPEDVNDDRIHCRPSKRSDMFALACIFVELYTGKRPIPHDPGARRISQDPSDFHIQMRILNGHRALRPSLVEGGIMSDPMWSLTTLCWHQKPHLRPSAAFAVQALAAILRDVQATPHRARQLPTEIWEEIIDRLNHRPSLCACIRVCHAWTPRSRYHLLANVTLSTSAAFFSFSGLLRSSSHLSDCVRHLMVTSTGGVQRWLLDAHGLPAMKNLESLELRDITLGWYIGNRFLEGTRLRPAHLVVRNVVPTHAYDVTRIVRVTQPTKLTWEHMVPGCPIPSSSQTAAANNPIFKWSRMKPLTIQALWSDLVSIIVRTWRATSFNSLMEAVSVCLKSFVAEELDVELRAPSRTIWHDVVDMFKRICMYNRDSRVFISMDLGHTGDGCPNMITLCGDILQPLDHCSTSGSVTHQSLNVSISPKSMPTSFAMALLLSCFPPCDLHTLKLKVSLSLTDGIMDEWQCVDESIAEHPHFSS